MTILRADGLPFDAEGLGTYEPLNGSNVVVNFWNGLGLLGTDPNVTNQFVRPRRLTWSELDALHTDALGRRIAELPGHEATREGYQVRPIRPRDTQLAQRIVDRLTARVGDLGLLSALFEARWRRRTFGSCLIVAGTEDCFVRDPPDDREGRVIQTDFSKPLRTGAEVLWLRTFDARRYRIREVYGEGHPLCGKPRVYEVQGWDRPGLDADYYRLGARVPSTSSTRLVHASRVWRDAEPEGWSIFDGLARDLARLLSGAKGAEDALAGMAVPVYEIADLAMKLQRDEAGVRAQIKAANQAKSMLNPLIVEKDKETFTWQRLQLAGVSDIINSLGYLLSASTGIPMTLLFGMSPGGFSGGDSEESNWLNYVRSVQRELGHGVTFVLDLLLREMGIDPDMFPFAVEWNKLVVLDDLDSAELRDKAATYWKKIVDGGIVKPSEVRSSAFGGEGFSLDVTVDATGTGEDDARANLDGREATAVMAMLQAYFLPGSLITAESARAYIVAVNPSLVNQALLMIPERPPGWVGVTTVLPAIAATTQSSNPVGPIPLAETPTADDLNAVQEREPDATGNTWRTAPELAAVHGTTASFVRRMATEGQVASRRGTGKHRARQYAEEHLLEALQGAESPRAQASDGDLASDE